VWHCAIAMLSVDFRRRCRAHRGGRDRRTTAYELEIKEQCPQAESQSPLCVSYCATNSNGSGSIVSQHERKRLDGNGSNRSGKAGWLPCKSSPSACRAIGTASWPAAATHSIPASSKASTTPSSHQAPRLRIPRREILLPQNLRSLSR
jgi:hypothetical protein